MKAIYHDSIVTKFIIIGLNHGSFNFRGQWILVLVPANFLQNIFVHAYLHNGQKDYQGKKANRCVIIIFFICTLLWLQALNYDTFFRFICCEGISFRHLKVMHGPPQMPFRRPRKRLKAQKTISAHEISSQIR